MKNQRLLSLTLIVITGAIVQSLGFAIFGVKPNLVLIFLILISLQEEFFFTLFSSAVAVFILKSSPFLDVSFLVLAVFPAAVLFLKKRFSWQELPVCLFFIFLGTVLIYLIDNPQLIETKIFAEELIFNLSLGWFFFAIFSWTWQNKQY